MNIEDQPPAPASRTDIPDHLIVDFDLYDVPGADDDVQAAYHALHATAPDIFWTPRNQGHWVVTRLADIRHVHGEHQFFSHEPAVSIPPVHGGEPKYPIQSD